MWLHLWRGEDSHGFFGVVVRGDELVEALGGEGEADSGDRIEVVEQMSEDLLVEKAELGWLLECADGIGMSHDYR